MAFTTRADRQTVGEKVGSTPATVGPGSYGSYFNQEVDHAYAPFSSTTDRDAGGAVRPSEFITPGPGSYDVTGRKYFGGPRFLSAPSEAGFLSKSARMVGESQEKLGRPGPGAYSLQSSFEVKQMQKSAQPHPVGREDKHVVWFRAPTAPSIPCQDQAFGYEEGPAGQLIKQQAPIKRFKGDKKDMVGPGAYDGNMAATRPNIRGHDFGRSRGVRTELAKSLSTTAEAPGPGSYDTPVVDEVHSPPQRKKPTANFASRVLRPHQIPKQELDSKKPVPGPGAYSLPDAFSRAGKALPDALQCFGSTSKRVPGLTQRDKLPGPGSYDDPRSSFLDQTGMAGATRIQRRAAPFLSTGGRFDSQKMKQGLPGPGQYDETNRDNFVAQLAKKRFSRGGHFGSTSKRFVPNTDAAKPREGAPSTYEQKVPKPVHGHLKKGPMSIFLSNTHRTAKPEDRSGPAPGQYYKSVEWGTGYRRPDNGRGGVFISQAQRFGGGDNKAVPGPGQYSQDVMTVGAEVQKVLKRRILNGDDQPSVHFGTESRFAGGRGADAPGPGSYDAVDPYGQLLKRSFNITVEGSV